MGESLGGEPPSWRLALVCVMVAAAAAHADTRGEWGFRVLASRELAPAAPRHNGAIVPGVWTRWVHRTGAVLVGGMVGTSWPAANGHVEGALSLDHERVLREPVCLAGEDIPGGIPLHTCRGLRWSVVLGADLGMSALWADAPEHPEPGDPAAVLWGPSARAHVQLHVLAPRWAKPWPGVAVGASLGAVRAHYEDTASGTGLRVEPGLDIALAMRL